MIHAHQVDTVDTQYALAALIAGIAMGMGLFYSYRQLRALQRLRTEDDIPEADRQYTRKQARLRLAGCVLLLLLGAMVAGGSIFKLEQRAQELGDLLEARKAKGEPLVLNEDQERFRWFYILYWIVVLLLLLGVVGLAGVDLWVIRRYRRQQLQQIKEDRRAMIAEQVARLKTERNGQG